MDILGILASLISAISLIALVYQTVNLKRTIDNQIYASFISNSVEIDKILIEYPELRKYVYDNEEVNDSTPNIDQIMALIELIVDVTENIEVYNKYLPQNRKNGWLRFVSDTQKTSAYKYFMNNYGKWFEID